MSRRFLEALRLRDLSEIRRAMLNERLLKRDPDAHQVPGPKESPAEDAPAELPRTGLRAEARTSSPPG